MGDCSGAHHDPDGPVVVTPDVPLALVRAALGPTCWLERPGWAQGYSVLVTGDRTMARDAESRGIPVIAADGEDVLVARLRAFDDGALITTAEGEALAWIEAIRAEEERNQRDRERMADERVEALQDRVDELEAHLASIEASRSWVLARRLVSAKERLTRTLKPRRGP